MRKFVVIFLVLCVAVSVPATAHSGRTDSSGGHTNHSTGEYHYHHGYPAHDHYDMDGDGDKDCPYCYSASDYNPPKSTSSTNQSAYPSDRDTASDYTKGYNAGFRGAYKTIESLRSSLKNANEIIDSQVLSLDEISEDLAKSSQDLDALKLQMEQTAELTKKKLIWIPISAALAMMILCIIFHNRSAKRKEEDYRSKLKQLEQDYQSQIEGLQMRHNTESKEASARHRKVIETYSREIAFRDKAIDRLTHAVCDASGLFSQKDLFFLLNDPADEYGIKIPDHIHLTEDGTPYTGKRKPDRPYGDLTRYAYPSGGSVHRTPKCSGGSPPMCLFDPHLPSHACCTCSPNVERVEPDVLWYTALQRLKQEKTIRTVRDIVDAREQSPE